MKPAAKIGNPSARRARTEGLLYEMAGWVYEVRLGTRLWKCRQLLKVDKSAEVALQQIEDKHYAAPFGTDSRKLYKIGVSFSSNTRKIEEYKIVES